MNDKVIFQSILHNCINGKVLDWAAATPNGTTGVANGIKAALDGFLDYTIDMEGFEKAILPTVYDFAGLDAEHRNVSDSVKEDMYRSFCEVMKEHNALIHGLKLASAEEPEVCEEDKVLASALTQVECPKDISEYVSKNVHELYSKVTEVLGKRKKLKADMAHAYADECFNAIADAGEHGLQFANDFRSYLRNVMAKVTETYGEHRESIIVASTVKLGRKMAEKAIAAVRAEAKEYREAKAAALTEHSVDATNLKKYLFDCGLEPEDMTDIDPMFSMLDCAQVKSVVLTHPDFFPDELVEQCRTMDSLSEAGTNGNVIDELGNKIVCGFGVIIGFPIAGDNIEIVDFGYDPVCDRHECEFQCSCGNFTMEGAAGWDKDEWHRQVTSAVLRAMSANRGADKATIMESAFHKVR